MLFKVFFLCLCLFTVNNAETCLSVVGACIGGMCPPGESCINDVCCITADSPSTVAPLSTSTPSQTCLSIVGPCLDGQCVSGESCINDVCCITSDSPSSTYAPSSTSTPSQTCLSIVGPCFDGECASGYSCINDVCCTTTDEETSPPTNALTVAPQACLTMIGYCPDGHCASGYSCVYGWCCTTTHTEKPETSVAPTIASTCYDQVDENGVSDCPELAYLCNDQSYFDLMTQQCPKTCNRCSSSASTATTVSPDNSCMDKINEDGTSDCPVQAYLCNNSLYYDLMTQQCPKTCNRC